MVTLMFDFIVTQECTEGRWTLAVHVNKSNNFLKGDRRRGILGFFEGGGSCRQDLGSRDLGK